MVGANDNTTAQATLIAPPKRLEVIKITSIEIAFAVSTLKKLIIPKNNGNENSERQAISSPSNL